MLPIHCPNCGRRGSIPNDRYRGRLHCAKCDAVFHLDRAGHLMLGEPGAPRPDDGSPGAESARPGKDTTADAVRIPTWLAASLALMLAYGLFRLVAWAISG
jgi:hypothetical protein